MKDKSPKKFSNSITESDIILAHKKCINHRRELKSSQICGCFYCEEIFTPNLIDEWTDDDTTALCPKCGVDSIIGDQSGYPITVAFLNRMHKYWF